ncbi:uncharacterized protein LOC117136580 isoform X3 [Drosophila mauritiana]|uniref:Uncharacterized protein LOC117136580 isoform X3 n=1 Tax=Drosophila mauritiana TaxID=7226 RepID=A0A6P8JKU4_DROMA|nr:uncharacterized protein LOC117136580 isoform X3 [Drosophila mauritiana]
MHSIYLLLFGSYLFWSVLSEPNIVYKLKNIECSTVPGFSANASCRIRAINWNKATAEMDVYLLRTLYNITIIFRFDFRSSRRTTATSSSRSSWTS